MSSAFDGTSLLTDKPQTLKGKLAVITGCTRGIGLEITYTLASLGCQILGTYSNSSSSASTTLSSILSGHTKYVGVCADIRTPSSSIAAIVSALDTSFPKQQPVDIVVNNAAVATLSPLRSLDAQDLLDSLTGNTIFPALLLQALLPRLATDGGARIINISSEGSHLGRANTTAYSASKAALESMTRTWAKELGQEYGGLTVNALALGMVKTDLYWKLPEHRREFWEEKLKETPVEGRVGCTQDVAGVVEFLVGEGSRWVSGQVIAVGGGNLMIV
ncbi:dehydrogenase with different specificitie [Sphaerosporella brunnea]|uniref:Dehydrogenase with different specificitie n=1 Tax=Sphaerosporella brunnea TaxID=1250544 RepID=A0A5J5EDV4_9PEZI|nr:dehydrogenase with different specificitie [Sphaerosporella brunnea]